MFNSRETTSLISLNNAISEYNRGKSESEQIKFLHGGNSSIFAFIGRTTTVFNKATQQFESTVIPASLIPTGVLRKKYGVYPFSGELEIGAFTYGSRKSALNYRNISGMGNTSIGVSTTYEYAMTAKRFKNINNIHIRIKLLIEHMDDDFYIRSLKILVMEITNLMLIDEYAALACQQYLRLIIEKQKDVESMQPTNSTVGKYFAKYTSQIAEIISGKRLPFTPDNEFRETILSQYPVIFCSTIEPMDFSDGMPCEKIFRGGISLETVKILFTPNDCVADLKNKLLSVGLTSIQVVGFYTPQPFFTMVNNDHNNSDDESRYIDNRMAI